MGVSHLLEHMVFKGTTSRSALEIALALEVLGGSLDAYTSREHTSFQARVLDEHVETAAEVLCDLIFHPVLRGADLTPERKVVLEEIGMVEDAPDDLVFELHNELLWGSHPFGYSILGTRETVGALGADDLRALHDRAYHPGQMVLAAAGNIEHQELLDVLRRTGWLEIPAGEMRPMESPAPAPAGPADRHVERDSAQTHIVLGTPAVRYGDPRRFAVALASMHLGGGMSSRLFQRIREELGLAYSIHSFHSFHARTGMHGVYVGTSPETAAAARNAIMEEMDALARRGMTPKEIAAAKGQLKGQITLSLESPASRMYRAASGELYGEPFQGLDEVLAEIDALTPEMINGVCGDIFAPARQTVLSLGPHAAA
jgi:predicted Zn-dependent peptidase